jgi:exopolysaccharide biosynthesis protein
MKRFIVFLFPVLFFMTAKAQLQWVNADTAFGPLPPSVHVYKTTTPMDDGKPNIAYYVEADLNDKHLYFGMDTAKNRRLKPSQFYIKGYEDPLKDYENINYPLVVVNTTFFSFTTNQSLNAVVKDGKLVSYNVHSLPGRGKDTFTYRHPFHGAIGISKKRKADIAWLYTDSSKKYPYALPFAMEAVKDSVAHHSFDYVKTSTSLAIGDYSGRRGKTYPQLKKWKMRTAVAGGPVLLQNGNIAISNNEELKFAGKAIDDKHPRTAMGYTKDNKLIILVVEGRNPGKAEGATLTQQAKIFKDLGCAEALNLDGGGSSCMLVNGKETIKVSDGAQRPVPAVFIIKRK